MEEKSIGYRIKIARENANITQEKLAERIGCTTQHMSAIERGVKLPRLDTFISISNALNVSSDLLLQDLLEYTTDPLAVEFSSIVSPLPKDMQLCILKAICAFVQGVTEK